MQGLSLLTGIHYICLVVAYFVFLHKVHKSCPLDLHRLTLSVVQGQDEMEKIGFSEVGGGLLFIMCPCQANTAAGREGESSSVKYRTRGVTRPAANMWTWRNQWRKDDNVNRHACLCVRAMLPPSPFCFLKGLQNYTWFIWHGVSCQWRCLAQHKHYMI